MLLRCLEYPLHVLDGPVLPDAFPNHLPRKTLLTQYLILWIDEDDSSIVLVDIHLFLLVPLRLIGRGDNSQRLCHEDTPSGLRRFNPRANQLRTVGDGSESAHGVY